MRELLSCEFNMDTACVELIFTDSSIVSIDCIAVEDVVTHTMYQQSELDYLVYNKPLEYAQLILGSDLEKYIQDASEHQLMD